MIFRALAASGLIALVFGLGSYYATGEASLFAWVNVAGGLAALAVGLAGALRGIRGLGAPAARRVLLPRVALLAGVVAVAVGLEALAERVGWRLDWTAEQRFQLSGATVSLLDRLGAPLEMTFYRERGDARARRTLYLLKEMAKGRPIVVHERWLEDAQSEADQFGVQTTEAVVLQQGDRFETVDRPTEGTLYEALWRLHNPGLRTIYASFGEGEGDLSSLAPDGYSGLRGTLETEGYEVRDLVTATGAAVPGEEGAVLVVAPQRAFGAAAAESLRRFLHGGGGLVAFLEPGVESGLEPLLAEYGFELPDGVIVDPPSGSVAGGAPGVHPIASIYSEHPVTRGLGARTLSLFLEARPVLPARKPAPDDALWPLVFSSASAWLAPPTLATLRGEPPPRPADQEPQRWPFVSAGRYPQEGREARIVVFGDATFADNGHLRSLYNLDLVLNAVHWVLQREEDIAIRPKILTPNQDPLTPQQSLAMLYGVGLLLPELLLIAGAVTWLRRRGA